MFTRFVFLMLTLCLGAIPTFAVADALAPIKMGVTLPLTGGGAEWGVAAKNGLELVVAERPDVSRVVTFIFATIWCGVTFVAAKTAGNYYSSRFL